ncbi:MAG: CotH kinase family protein, partial [Bacteroidia bacterium]|nr:CotH kinase family protein [Bacteroidia bacterium]
MSSNIFLSVGINDNSTTYGAVPVWFVAPFTSSNLPLVIINTNGQTILDDPRIVADMGIIYNGIGNRNNLTDTSNNYDGQISIELRGSSSLGFPKTSFSLETQDSSGNNLNVSLLGLPKENDWVLYAPYSDKSLIRNVLTYKLGNDLDWYAPRTVLCELILNGQYWGVYVLTEKIKR